MSKLNDSLLSGSSGRTGRLVVANVNGTEILRVRPRKSAKPVSPKQELIRTRMKACYAFLESYKNYASAFFGMRVGMKSSYNQAMGSLLNAFKLNYTTMELQIEYPEIQFSKGILPGAVPTGIESPQPQTLRLEWYNNAGGNTDREADDLQVLCAVEGEASTVFFENAALRLDTELELTLPPNMSGKTLHVYVAFRSAMSLDASPSAYVGSVTVL